MRALVLTIALVCASVSAQDHMHDLPVGTGPSADGAAWLIVHTTGMYSIFGGEVMGLPTNPMFLTGNRVYRIYPHKGDLEWITPDSKQRAKVPMANLLPVVARLGSGK